MFLFIIYNIFLNIINNLLTYINDGYIIISKYRYIDDGYIIISKYRYIDDGYIKRVSLIKLGGIKWQS